ncbi:MAG: FlaD/FlaE family flagellar protein [Haloarculaceae archaeon]
MTINPKDYDLNELREMARKSDGPSDTRGGGEVGGSGGADPSPPDPNLDLGSENRSERDDAFRAHLYRELLPLESSLGDDVSKPYLTSLPETQAAEYLLFEWLEFLQENAGFRGATEALDYYESVGWITEDVESDLSEYLLGLDERGDDRTDLEMDDHLLSLVYVAKLLSMI